MKKSYSLSDEAGAFPSFNDGNGVPAPAPAAANDGLIFDDGEPFAQLDAAGAISVSAGSAKPVVAISTLADYLVNGFWQYNNTVAHHWASNTISYNISGLNPAEQFLAQTALQAWHEVANVNFVQTTGTANITFSDAGTMQAVTGGSWYSNGAMASANVDISSDWITNDGGARDGKTGIDSYGYQSYIHEIGHALGLGHQGPYNGSAVYSTDALYADDTWQYSIMSYFSQNNFSGGTYRYVVSPQIADIYAVDSIYGAATTTRTGDTVYGFHSNAGTVFDFNAYTRAPALTIYDSGGNDTLDCSGYSAAQTIDLHAGAFSSVGGLVNNIGIASNTSIENAIGGSGNDTLIANDNGCTLSGGAGNDALIGGAGNDRLIGGTGIDTMTGNGGADTFVFVIADSSATTGQHDRITDFVSGTDHIDLSGIDAIVSSAGVDQFYFIGSSAFDGRAGELDYSYNSALGVTIVQGDTNGDRVADFAIDLVGNLALSLTDFIGAYSTPVVIEAAGATTLAQLGGSYVVYANGTSPGPTLKLGGSTITVGQFGAWAPIGAEAVSGGYDVAWKLAGADQYTVWSTDANGNDIVALVNSVSGSSAALQSLETTLHQDLNGDSIIGIPPVTTTTIEALGSTKLDIVGTSYALDLVAGGTGPTLKLAGSTITVGQFGAWAPIGAEAVSGGYDVAWKLAGADQYTVWSTDANGNDITPLVNSVSGSSTALQSLETTLHQDLNGDGIIGIAVSNVTVIEALGSTKLDIVGTDYSLDPVAGGTGPTLKLGGSTITVGQFGAWAPIGAEAVSGGYDVAWKLAGADQYTVWSTDANGNDITPLVNSVSGSSTALQSLETTLHQDLNGDHVIGPTSQQPVGNISPGPGAASQITASVAVGNDSFVFGGPSGAGTFPVAAGNTAIELGGGSSAAIALSQTQDLAIELHQGGQGLPGDLDASAFIAPHLADWHLH